MVPDRPQLKSVSSAPHRLLRIAFSLLYAGLTFFAWSAPVPFVTANDHDEVALRQCVDEPLAPADQAVAAPQGEGSEAYPPTSLRFDSDHCTVLLWQPPELASSRIIPQGLVLSFLCDSARHQCSGVQLA